MKRIDAWRLALADMKLVAARMVVTSNDVEQAKHDEAIKMIERQIEQDRDCGKTE